jgi:hypothetical protein
MPQRLAFRRRLPVFLALVATLLLAPVVAPAPAVAQDTHIKYRTLQTKDLRLYYYSEDHAYVVRHLSRCYENSIAYHERLFGYKPSGPVTISFQDFDDYGYAGTSTIPFNYITLGIEPFEYVYDTCPTNERMNWVTNHELVHVVAADQATGADRFFRRVFFGKVSPSDDDPISVGYSYLTNPRRYAPRWYHEGIAVFMETWMAGGIGRTLTGYDEMVFRTMVRDSSYFYENVGLQSEGTAIDFQAGQVAYLYGTRFDSYLAYKYGPERLIDWVKRNPGSSRYFASQFKKIYGVSLDDEWSNWIRFEHAWQKTNLDSIRQYPVTPARPLSRRALGSVSREFYDQRSGRLYAAVDYPGDFCYIASIDVKTGDIRKLCEIATPALYYVCSLARDDSSGTLFFTTNNGRGLRSLNSYSVANGEQRLLFKNCRTGDLAFNRRDKTLWGVQHNNGYSSIVRFPPPYTDGRMVLTLPYGKDIFDIDVSPDGTYLSGTLAQINGVQQLILMETKKLLVWDSSYEVLWEFEKNPAENFVFSDDGRYLYGTSYLTGASNIFRYDIAGQKMETLSNAETGLFRPIPVPGDSIIAFSFTGKGFVPVMIPDAPIQDVAAISLFGQAVFDKHPQLADWKLGSPLTVQLDSLITSTSDYHELRSIRPTAIYPVTEQYKSYATVGLKANLMDPLWHSNIDAALTYSPAGPSSASERWHGRFKYENWRWTVDGAYNRADFYDYFGPTKVSRKGYSAGVQFKGYPLTDPPRSMEYTLQTAYYGDLERMPDYQNIATSFDRFLTAGGALHFKSLRSTIGAIEAEKGMTWSLNEDNSLVRSKVFPRLYGTFDYGILLPIEHSSLWLRTAGGWSPGARTESFANFYFGGFGNNWIDHAASVNRYREYYSFPGVELDAIGGTNFGKALAEWTLPPVRFKRIGVAALYANWLRLALFSSGIIANMDDAASRRELMNAGVQVNLKVVIFSSLESTFSVGFAEAFEEGSRPSHETMVSLKILK